MIIVILYFAIPLGIIVYADIRAAKGKKSVIMLTAMIAVQSILNLFGIVGAQNKNDNNAVIIGLILIISQVLCYVLVTYITSINAEKAKRKIILRDYNFRLQDERINNKLTPQQVAGIIGINKKLYEKYELGKEDIPVSTLIQLAKLYKVSTDHLLGMKVQEVQRTDPGSEQQN